MQQGKWMERIRWICWPNGVQKRTFYEIVLIWGIRRMIMAEKVRDLRSALERLKNMPGQLAETDVAVGPMAELAGVYRYVGAGGTVKRPTKEGPAMIFRNIKGHPDASVRSVSWRAGSVWLHFWTVSRRILGKCCITAWKSRLHRWNFRVRRRVRRLCIWRRIPILI